MKITMVTQFFHPRIGGVERHVYQVSRALVEGGDDVDIITWKYDDNLHNFDEIDGIRVHRLLDEGWNHARFRRIRGWAGFGKMKEIWGEANVIHFHDYTPLIEWFLPFFFKKRETFITFHGYEGYPIPRMSIVLRRFSDMMVRGNICVGSFIPKHYGTRCSYITYGGVTSLSTGEKFEKEGAVYIGGLREDLGIRGYISALSVLRERYGQNLALDVVGDGPLREEILSLAEDKGVALRFHGQQEDPTQFLARAKLALADSYLTILEAMALRVPVFSFHDNPLKSDYLFSFPGSREIAAIRDDPDELAIDLANFLETPETLEDKVERGYAFAIEQTWTRVADLYRKLYAGRR